jgi:hypothetical protein
VNRPVRTQDSGPTSSSRSVPPCSAWCPSMQLGEGNDNTTELAVQFWTRPDDQVIECLVERLDDEFGADVTSVSLRS